MSGYRTDIEEGFVLGARIEIEHRDRRRRGKASPSEYVGLPNADLQRPAEEKVWVLVQRHVQSPHQIVWESEPYSSYQQAEDRHLQLRADALRAEGRAGYEAIPALTDLAFQIHWSENNSRHHGTGVDRGALANCHECYEIALELAQDVCRDLRVLGPEPTVTPHP